MHSAIRTSGVFNYGTLENYPATHSIRNSNNNRTCCYGFFRWLLIFGGLFILIVSIVWLHNIVYEHYPVSRSDTIYCSPKFCGFKNPPNLKIIGGRVSSPHYWPWQAALFEKSRRQSKTFYSFVCGASLISEKALLTAAHCINKSAEYFLKLGIVKETSFDEPNEKVLGVKSVHIHPLFDSSLMFYDIALLKLDKPIACNKDIRPICLPKQNENLPEPNSTLTVLGWGTTGTNSTEASLYLKDAQIPLVDETICRNIYGVLVDYSFNFCAGYKFGDADTCQGDSGGPILQWQNGSWQQIGITSWGDGCAKPFRPGVYTRISSCIDWIDNLLK